MRLMINYSHIHSEILRLKGQFSLYETSYGTSRGKFIILLLLIYVNVLLVPVQGCPASCICITGEVVCKKGPLLDVFTQMVPDTVNLTLDSIRGLQIINPSRMRELTVNGSLLVKMRIISSYVQDVEAKTFEKFPNLKELDLSMNEITAIRADAFWGLSSLTYLNLSQNRLSSVAGIFSTLPTLRTLDISWNFIKNLSSDAFVKQDLLTYLKLDGNPIKVLYGSTFTSLYNLKELRARECSLTDVMKDIFSYMPLLSVVDLGLNRLKEAPLPGVFLKHRYLKTLILYHNVIEVLYTDNFNSVGLHTVDLSSNRINKIDQLAFRGSGINNLDLSHNSIIHLEPVVLKELSTSLTHLNLASNPLRKLDPGLFSDLMSLEDLNISKCSLDEFTVQAFEGSESLKQIDLSHNDFHFLPEGAFSLFNKMSLVRLEENAWDCDCKVKPLKDWLSLKDRTARLQCSNAGKNDSECSRLFCVVAHAGESREISMLSESELTECLSEENASTLAAGTQGAIVASCMGFAIILLLFAIFLWKKGQTGNKLKRICAPSEAESSHVIDEDSKIPPLANCDRNSLTHSDHNFVFRHYFDHLDMDEIETTDEDELAQGGEADPLKQRDSLYSSQPSLYSHPTEAAYGVESTV